ncbi:MAG TPA: STAS domain-containing protein [Verrucomicrobiota bacterium]|nr:hypothetical protein [Verrucomicrobiales bacterium]HRI15628.1 STAS domain-containing protein [Verrucomicrobiota bacterium]
MALPGSKMLVLVERPTAYVRLVGRAAVEGAPDFKLLIRRLSEEGVHQFCLDLTECRLMDSTFSGVLAALASESGSGAEQESPQFTLVNPNPRITDLLDNLGVFSLVKVLHGDIATPAAGSEQEVPAAGASKDEIAQCCLEAHEFLKALKPENRAKFSELTRMLGQRTLAGR